MQQVWGLWIQSNNVPTSARNGVQKSNPFGGVEAAVAARVRVGWRKFKEISGMLCGRDVSMKIKGQLYKACVRSAMCYGAECWALRKEEVTRLRMVRMMCGKTLKDKCQSQELRARVGVDDIEGFLRSHRLRWAGHVEMSRRRWC